MRFRPGGGLREGALEARVVPANLPAGFVDATFATGLVAPTAMAFAPDGRLFVAEQAGRVRVIAADGTVAPAPFVTLADVAVEGERGLAGLAIDPDFETNGYVYLYYTVDATPRFGRIVRVTAAGDVAAPGSQVTLLELDPLDPNQPPFHVGGGMQFAPDGTLLVGVGDGRVGANAQSTQTLLGKVLRINRDGSIPADNPLVGKVAGRNQAIWATGLRNPFTLAIQPETGLVFLNDVGLHDWEEINVGLPGANYGWPAVEGPSSDARFVGPLFAYRHGAGLDRGSAIVGGAFSPLEGGTFPEEYRGDYFFQDYTNGWMRRLDPRDGSVSVFATGLPTFPVDLDVDPAGNLYVLARGDEGRIGEILQIRYAAQAQPPTITQGPASVLASAGHPTQFVVSASGTGPLSYQWQLDGEDIPGANGPVLDVPPVKLSDDGARLRVVVTNAVGRAVSAEATLSVTADRPPVAVITSPGPRFRYRPGSVVRFAGVGVDPEGGLLPASAFTWEVVFHHDAHTHPFLTPSSGMASGRFRIPRARHDPGVVWYRVRLMVTDAAGLTGVAIRDVFPVGRRA